MNIVLQISTAQGPAECRIFAALTRQSRSHIYRFEFQRKKLRKAAKQQAV